jgi:Flp pilus assembly protein TadD
MTHNSTNNNTQDTLLKGIKHCQNGETDEGIALFLQALNETTNGQQQTTAAIWFYLGLAYRTTGQLHNALNAFTKSAQSVDSNKETSQPTYRDLILNLGQVHFELEQYPEAVTQFLTLTTLQPHDASAWLTLGFILAKMDQYDNAANALRTAETLDPDSPEVCLHLAETLRKAYCYSESLPYYQRMLQAAAEYPQAIHGYGKSLLALGNLENGWDAMEFRFASSIGSWERHGLPNWTPKSNETHVLAYSEEGVGADLMFASCLPDLINNVDHCIVECESSLHRLFRRSFPRADFVPLADDDVTPTHNSWNISLDTQIAFGSLPRYFRRNIEDCPMRKA